MSLERKCRLCESALKQRAFWDNLNVHKDCFNKVLQQVIVQPTGEVKLKKEGA